MEEIWRDVKDFEGLYQVSNFGRVRSLDHYVNAKNFSHIGQCCNGKQHTAFNYKWVWH